MIQFICDSCKEPIQGTFTRVTKTLMVVDENGIAHELGDLSHPAHTFDICSRPQCVKGIVI